MKSVRSGRPPASPPGQGSDSRDRVGGRGQSVTQLTCLHLESVLCHLGHRTYPTPSLAMPEAGTKTSVNLSGFLEELLLHPQHFFSVDTVSVWKLRLIGVKILGKQNLAA